MDKAILMERIQRKDDFSLISRLLFCPQVMEMNMGRVFTRQEAQGYFAFLLEYNAAHTDSGAYKVFRPDGEFIGLTSLVMNGEDAEVEYMVLPGYWNQGYATEMVRILTEMAGCIPGLNVLRALTDPANLPSQKVLTKNGFTLQKTETVEEDGSLVQVYERPLSHTQGDKPVLFHRFSSRQERRDYGGSAFIEIQFCRMPPGTPERELVSSGSIHHWQEDSLYVEDESLFYREYGVLFEGGMHNNLERGAVDLYGINYYAPDLLDRILRKIHDGGPADCQTLLDWLNRAKQYNGFYILGI